MRTCAGCRRVRAAGELVRLVATDAGRRVTLDLTRRRPGRGSHICRDSWVGCLEQARRRRFLARSLRVGNDVIDHSRLEDEFSRLFEEHSP
ncbi:MAG: YlxR family protein [Chloroflexi bacterium]|nr:MAG: YlxR family protein [Chloroflexota bacterium]